MAINVEIRKGASESNMSVMRRFRKRVQGSSVLSRARQGKQAERPKSKTTKKKNALKRIEKREYIQKLIKLGKPLPRRRRRY